MFSFLKHAMQKKTIWYIKTSSIIKMFFYTPSMVLGGPAIRMAQFRPCNMPPEVFNMLRGAEWEFFYSNTSILVFWFRDNMHTEFVQYILILHIFQDLKEKPMGRFWGMQSEVTNARQLPRCCYTILSALCSKHQPHFAALCWMNVTWFTLRISQSKGGHARYASYVQLTNLNYQTANGRSLRRASSIIILSKGDIRYHRYPEFLLFLKIPFWYCWWKKSCTSWYISTLSPWFTGV